MKWLLENKKKVIALAITLLSLLYGVAQLIPGDNPDKALKDAKDKLEQIDKYVPEDPATTGSTSSK